MFLWYFCCANHACPSHERPEEFASQSHSWLPDGSLSRNPVPLPLIPPQHPNTDLHGRSKLSRGGLGLISFHSRILPKIEVDLILIRSLSSSSVPSSAITGHLPSSVQAPLKVLLHVWMVYGSLGFWLHALHYYKSWTIRCSCKGESWRRLTF